MAFKEEIQKLEMDRVVSLFTLDTTPIGGTEVFRFTSMPYPDGTRPSFGGISYEPIDIEASGFKWDGQGVFPSPKIAISNVDGFLTAAIINFGDLVGSQFTRIRTFAKHLDGEAEEDSFAHFPLEIYTVNQRTEHNSVFVEWEMKSALDQASIMLPGRQAIRETCTHTYRIWNANTGTFDYSTATCPYAGQASYDDQGKATISAFDNCGRKISDCKLRFGNEPLPTRAFPGIARTRI